MKKKNKDKAETDFSTLLIFGYGCKIFRDDERAVSIDSGQHLIPWMGDPSLRIDRYDGRGHLYNLSEYEAKPGASHQIDDLERHEEELCEEERWRALYHDDSEDVVHKEEELKRSDAVSGGAEFQFNYGDGGADGDDRVVFGPEVPENQNLEDDDSEEYIPAPELDLPPSITVPSTVKQFSVIEKTAILIAKQGPQMEILLKTKQSGNPVFDFLTLDHKLNKFYKHLILLVKTKQYRKRSDPVPPKVSLVPQYSDLPPVSIPTPAPAPKVASVQYKRSEDCAYSQLINKLQKYAPAPAPAPVNNPPPISSAPESKESSPAPSQEQVKMPDGPIIIPASSDLQTIIDKTASYVAKNGRSFEDIVYNKDKSRFVFLKSSDRHYNYYLHKLNIYLTGNYDSSVTAQPLAFKLNKKPESSKESKVTASNPISGLDYSSDSDNEGKEAEEDKPAVEDNSDPKDKAKNFPNLAGFLPPTITSNPKLYSDPSKELEAEESKKRQEEANKLRDKLAAKAREKMVQVAKEKALQLERKRKAAQFLAQLAEKKTTVSSVTPISGDQEGDSSAEEGEIPGGGGGAETDSHEISGAAPGDSVSVVTSWPPPAPPKLVIPKLAASSNPVVELSSDSEEDIPKKRRRSRSRSRSRRRDKQKYKRRSRSRSRHKKSRRKDRKKYSSSDRDSERRRRKRRHRHRSSESESDKSSRRKSDHDESHSEDDRKSKEKEVVEVDKPNPIIEGIVQPTVNKMTEELRAKVRAMLANK